MSLTFALAIVCSSAGCASGRVEADELWRMSEAAQSEKAMSEAGAATQPSATQQPANGAQPAKKAQPSATQQPANGAQPAKKVAFDGGFEFMKMSRRLRIWRPAVEFDMKVDAEGHATDCEVVNAFRKNYINMKLCEVVMDHHTFEPARDAQNQPVPGSYHAKISYAQLREELD